MDVDTGDNCNKNKNSHVSSSAQVSCGCHSFRSGLDAK